MTQQEYDGLKKRLIEDFWAYIGHQLFSALMFVLEWSFKALSAALPIILAWLRQKGYLNE